MIDWHHLFGLTLIDFFTGSPFEVELEKDLSIKKQLLDVVILRKGKGEFKGQLPDGLDNLAEHNLLSYKSMRESLDSWTLEELIGHFVNYRKQMSSSLKQLLPEENFQLYGVCTMFPRKLAEQITLQKLQDGVYNICWGTRMIRLLVLSEMPEKAQNAIWLMFSGVTKKVAVGARRYQKHLENMSAVMQKLLKKFNLEELVMSYTMDDFMKEFIPEFLDELTPEEILKAISAEKLLQRLSAEERLKGLPAEERLKGLSPEEIFKRFAPEERLKGLSPEEIFKRFAPEERLKGLSPEEIEAYLEKLKKDKTH